MRVAQPPFEKRQDSGDRMSGENKKEEFRKYLERSGVIDSLTKVLVALYEEPEKPANALDFIKQYLGAPTRSLLLLLSTTFCPLLPTIGGVQSRQPLSLLPLLQLIGCLDILAHGLHCPPRCPRPVARLCAAARLTARQCNVAVGMWRR